MADNVSQLSSALDENEAQEGLSGPDALERHEVSKDVSDMNNTASVMADAEDYVDSVMSSQSLHAVLDPAGATTSGRKRNLSAGSGHESSKKIRGDRERVDGDYEYDSDGNKSDSEMGAGPKHDRRYISGKRNKQGSAEKKDVSDNRLKTTADIHVDHIDESDGIKIMIAKLSADMHKLISGVNEKVERVEKTLEKKITDSLTKYFDKRINTEAKKIRREMDERFDTLRADMRDEVDDLNEKLENLGTRVESKTGDMNTSKLSIVIRDLPYTAQENVEIKVNNLIKDGLKVRDVKVEAATRKDSYDGSKPGVIIAKLKSEDDKKTIMKEKKTLKNSKQYGKVFIHNDQKREDRLMASNFRLLLNAYKRGDKNISLRGDRIVTGRDQDISDNRREEESNRGSRHRRDSDRRPRNYSNSERSRRETRPSERDSNERDNRRQDQSHGRNRDRNIGRGSGRRSYNDRR